MTRLRSIGVRLAGGTIAVLLAVLALFQWIILANRESERERELIEQVEGVATTSAAACVDALVVRDYLFLEAVAEQLVALGKDIVFATVLRADGTIVASSGAVSSPPLIPTPPMPPIGRRGRMQSGAELFFIRQAITIDDTQLGSLELVVDSRRMAARNARDRGDILVLFGFLGGGLALFVAFFTWHTLRRPLERLQQSARGLAAGDLDTPVSRMRDDELGALALSLERMRLTLGASIEKSLSQQRELEVANATLKADLITRARLEADLSQAQKLEAIGQLAAGVAHEINTPTQYVADNVSFVTGAFDDLHTVLLAHERLFEEVDGAGAHAPLVQAVADARRAADMDYLREELPAAFDQIAEGLGHIATIVGSMKDFSHLATADEVIATDINRTITSTAMVAKHEWKYVANLHLELEPELPLASCIPSQVRQVLLNLIVNASHAIADRYGDSGQLGSIRIRTRTCADSIEIMISDDGAGIPQELHAKVFEPFFTTKEVGRGTGQGLAIVHDVVVNKHGGTLSFQSEAGKGTSFVACIPIATVTGAAA